MGRKVITKAVYDRIVQEFRETPGRPNRVATAAGVNRRTAIRAWEVGWPNKKLEPIRTLFEREQAKARAELAEQQGQIKAQSLDEQQRAINHAAKSRAEEGQMCRLARTTALKGLISSTVLADLGKHIGRRAEESIKELLELDPNDKRALSPNQALALLQKIVSLQKDISALAHDSMQLERLHLGQPQANVGIIMNQREMTLEEVQVRIATATDALRRAAQSGGLTIESEGVPVPTIGKLVEGE